ncbi:MAG: DegT/DnrJ/EryC1/StrS family aminotransferase [Cyclobacteriaceae bacterium]
MRKIQMVDLGAQYQQLSEQINAQITDVIENTAFINGSQVREFATQLADYCEVKHVVPCANGTDALQLAMMALDMPRGSEIIMPAFTYVSVAEVAAMLGYKPVFVDVDADSFNLQVNQLEEKITDNTRAIAVVHLFGQCADMEKILQIAKKHHLYVIEDAAQSIGCRYHFSDGRSAKAGTMGDVGTTSFFPSKNLGCYGDGGAVFTNNEKLAHTIKAISNHGQRTKYYHDLIGVNSRLDTLQAGILLCKLPHLDEYNRLRAEAALYYQQGLADLEEIILPQRKPYSDHVFHQYTLRLRGLDREAFRQHLKEQEIPSMVYYPKPMHLQEAYAYLGYNKDDFPVAEQLCEQVVSLPMHPHLSREQQEYITQHIFEYLKTQNIESE